MTIIEDWTFLLGSTGAQIFRQGLKDLALWIDENLCTSSTDAGLFTKTPLTWKENSLVACGNHTKYDVELVHFTSYLVSWLAGTGDVIHHLTYAFSEGLKEGSESQVFQTWLY